MSWALSRLHGRGLGSSDPGRDRRCRLAGAGAGFRRFGGGQPRTVRASGGRPLTRKAARAPLARRGAADFGRRNPGPPQGGGGYAVRGGLHQAECRRRIPTAISGWGVLPQEELECAALR